MLVAVSVYAIVEPTLPVPMIVILFIINPFTITFFCIDYV